MKLERRLFARIFGSSLLLTSTVMSTTSLSGGDSV